LTVEVSPTEGGTVSYQSGPFLVGTKVTLTASANTNYAFKEWTGAFNGTTNPMELIMNADNTVTAVFELLDTDGDGVTDDIDACQSTPEGETADETGCSPSQVDTDGDTVTDDKDDCPDTPEGSTVDVSGCPLLYLDANEVSVKATEDAEIGSNYNLNGVEYLVVDSTILFQMVANDEDLTKIVTTKLTNLYQLFLTKETFNQDISSWDVSNVTNMSYMFNYASSFNQDISGWDVSNVKNMELMFFADSAFNQDISSWDVGNVTNMWGLFGYTLFNQDIGNWDVSSVINMRCLFCDSQFDQDINSWDVSNVTNMRAIFRNSSFNQDISGWDVSSVNNMFDMFKGAVFFDKDINSWDVSNVTDMSRMFYDTKSFNQDINSWDVSNVIDCFDFNLGATAWAEPKPNFTNCSIYGDTDGDGVTDDLDTCANTAEGAEVDENGCADSQQDTDGDGVTDDLDSCINTEQGSNVDINGCQYFGITDLVDKNWMLLPDAGAISVGPGIGRGDWWSADEAWIVAVPCLFDDTFTFDDAGGFVIDVGDSVLLEDYMDSVSTTSCVPVADIPENLAAWGGGDFTYTFTEGSETTLPTISVTGNGAYLGFYRGGPGAEQRAPKDTTITYEVIGFGKNQEMGSIFIFVGVDYSAAGDGSAYWNYMLVAPAE
ncbi:BspA family leucine-rich repeat surface protein, partial [Cyclobacteriaceae bacterium]|nr:BspA family leucine-rich repeat surface protein [Cyclobacteriaceae bacterium]